MDLPRCRLELIPAILTCATPPVAASKIIPKVIIKNGKVATTISLPPCSTTLSDRKTSGTSLSSADVENEDVLVNFDEKNLLNSSELSSNTALPDTPPDSETSAILGGGSESEDSLPAKETPKSSQTIPSSLPEMENSPSLFWNNVTSRVDNLISNPSSFRRPRAHHF